jgi:hypothetical protein
VDSKEVSRSPFQDMQATQMITGFVDRYDHYPWHVLKHSAPHLVHVPVYDDYVHAAAARRRRSSWLQQKEFF